MLPTIERLAAMLQSGETTSRALVDGCLERAGDAAGEGGRVFLRLLADQARVAADAADRARALGLAPSPYAGIPVSAKDLFDLAGQPTPAGSLVLADAAPARRDAPAVARLRAAGLIVIGRTNMTEFAYSGLGLNPHHGTPRNPFDRAVGRIPGGSSSGAAVSVTDGMAAAGIGTDTGGSCRIPAALTGTVGFKPTAARIPLDGVLPLSPSLDSVGSIAGSVACCAVIDALMAGAPAVVPEPFPLNGLRLAVPEAVVFGDVDAAVAAAFEWALSMLSASGAVIDRLPMKELEELGAINAKGGFAAAESFAWHRALLAEKGESYDPRVRVRIEKGGEQSAADYLDLVRQRADVIRRVGRVCAPYDALAMPTVPKIAPAFDELSSDADYSRLNLLMLRNPAIINFLDGCAISLPCHAAGEAPVGLMLAGLHGQDGRLLSIARAVEAALAQGS